MRQSADIPEVDWFEWWDQFKTDYRSTRDNAQHVSILGPNGTGKSTLMMKVLSTKPYVGILAAKPRDLHMRAMLRQGGYVKVDRLPEAGAGKRRVVIWPKNRGIRDYPTIGAQWAQALDDAQERGVWHLGVDEGHFGAETLRLGPRLKSGFQMGRSNGYGLVLCAQRPAWLPRDIYSGASHLMIFGTNDSADLKSISGLNGVNDRTVRDCVAMLGRDKRFLHVNTLTGATAITRIPKGANP